MSYAMNAFQKVEVKSNIRPLHSRLIITLPTVGSCVSVFMCICALMFVSVCMYVCACVCMLVPASFEIMYACSVAPLRVHCHSSCIFEYLFHRSVKSVNIIVSTSRAEQQFRRHQN